jgi:hypothetical protein
MIIYVQQLYGDACVLVDGVVGSAGAVYRGPRHIRGTSTVRWCDGRS